MVRAEAGAYFLGALLVLTVPLEFLGAAAIAAAAHEAWHLGAIVLLEGSIIGFRLQPWGAVIQAEIPGKGRELLCAAAGPLGSLSLLFLCRSYPRIALCGLVQAGYNLLPVYPMDGGRILECLLSMIAPEKAPVFLKAAEILTCIVILLLAAAGTFVFSLGWFPLIGALFLFLRVFQRKIPCKRQQIGVQ